MKKNKQPDGMPVWFDGKNINEACFVMSSCRRTRSSSQRGFFSHPKAA